MVKVTGTTIEMTRGDSAFFDVGLETADGEPYVPEDGDTIKFTVKSGYKDNTPVIEKYVNMETMRLELKPEDTKQLLMPFTYVYDMELTKADGTVDTFIDKAKLIISEEVG